MFHSFQLKTRSSGSSGHLITNTGQLKSGKALPDLTNPCSCWVMLMAESGFDVSSMSPWTHPACCKRYRLVVMYRHPICRNCVMPSRQHWQTSLWNISDLWNPCPEEFRLFWRQSVFCNDYDNKISRKIFLCLIISFILYCFFLPNFYLVSSLQLPNGLGSHVMHSQKHDPPNHASKLTLARLTQKPAVPICRRKYHSTKIRGQPAGTRPTTRSR